MKEREQKKTFLYQAPEAQIFRPGAGTRCKLLIAGLQLQQRGRRSLGPQTRQAMAAIQLLEAKRCTRLMR